MSLEPMKRSQVIDIANRRTEKRAGSLDLNAEFTLALQELCLYQQWWWREKSVAFTLKAGQVVYDMSDPLNGIDAPDWHQVTKRGFKIYATPSGDKKYPQFISPEPVFDQEQQAMILALRSTWGTGQPGRYFIQGGGPAQFNVDIIPDKDYLSSLSYLAMPMFSFDAEDETIPLVPAALHSLLLKRLEIRLWGFALGEGSGPWEVATKEFENLVSKASIYQSFADGQRISLASREYGDAVQSS